MENHREVINEVRRLKEIMGLKKDLIVEQPILSKLAKEITPKLLKDKGSELVTLFSKLSDDTLTQVEREAAADSFIKIAKDKYPDVYVKIRKIAYNDDVIKRALDDLFDEDVITKFKSDVKKDFELGANQDEIFNKYKGMINRSNFSQAERAAFEERMRRTISDVGEEIKVNSKVEPEVNSKVEPEVGTPNVSEKVADNLVDEIPTPNTLTTESGNKVSNIFDTENWSTNYLVKVNDELLEEIVSQKWWGKFIENIKPIFKVSDDRLIKIQKIAKGLESTNNSELQSKLRVRLKNELEWLYRKDSNNFVYMKNYLDAISNNNKSFRKIWTNIKDVSDNGWDFWKTFGSVAEYNSNFKRIWGGITDNIEYVTKFRDKYSINPIKTFKKSTSPELKTAIKKNIENVFLTGTKRGFPRMSNELYTETIKKYGIKSARVSYIRDLLLQTIKLKLIFGTVSTLVSALASYTMRESVKACLNTRNTESEECESLRDTRIGRFWLSLALKYRGIDEIDEDRNLIKEILVNSIPFMGTNKIDFDDEGLAQVGELVKLDPGFAGNVTNGVLEFISLLDDPSKQDKFNRQLESEIKDLEGRVEKESEKIKGYLEDKVTTKKTTKSPSPIDI